MSVRVRRTSAEPSRRRPSGRRPSGRRPSGRRERRLEELRQRCLAHGLPWTGPRRAILEAVMDLDTHPTADQAHAAVVRRGTRIARATVYRALESFARVGVLRKVCHPGAAVRYDPIVERHHHLVCLRCDRIEDLHDARFDDLPVPDTSKRGFAVTDVRVQLRGLCRSCRKKEDTP